VSHKNYPPMQGPLCPLPINDHQTIVMGHGSGGLMTRELITRVFQPHFSNPSLLADNDFAIIPTEPGARLVISTDAHIVSPLFFPGGDIGRLAVSGTVNDIAVSGGKPLCLTASFIIEEGFPIDDLEKIAKSMAITAEEANVPIIAGDTKVVERGKADGVFISTSGVAVVENGVDIDIDTKWGGSKTFFSREGLFLLKIEGTGTMFASSFGAVHPITLGDGETCRIDTGHIVAFDDGVDYKVKRIGGLKSTFFSGEGLVVELTGPGRVWIQSRSEDAFLSWLIPRLPKDSGN